MKLDFNEIEKTVINKFKGGEKDFNAHISFDGMNKILHGTLEVGASIGLHKHETNSEIIYIISGDARCIYDDTVEFLKPGQCHYCPKGHTHSLINNSDSENLVFFAVISEQ
ncbi:MAG: cupin domain-containing protein [Ruminococcus sp.]|nr:cupin domain-containing protein [Ruminococcus sp.]